MESATTELSRELDLLEQRLARQFAPIDLSDVQSAVRESAAEFERSRIQVFVSLLTEKNATARLRAQRRGRLS